MKPVVSIMTTTYNRAGMLKEAIESVLDQTYQDWELLVYDDGSTDETQALVQGYQMKDPRVWYERQSHTGLSGIVALRNRALREARGPFIAFLDDDDKWFPEKLKLQVSYLEQHPEKGLVYSPVHVVDGKGRYQKTRPVVPSSSYADLFEGCFIQISSVVARKEILIALGGFDASLESSRDYDLWLRMARHYPFAYIDEPLGWYRFHPNAISNKLDRRHGMHFKILSRVPVEPERGITRKRKRRRLAVEAYRLARLYKERRYYLQAARSFKEATVYLPTVGLKICDLEPKGLAVLLQLVKPYVAILYCFGRYVAHPSSVQKPVQQDASFSGSLS